MKAPEQHVLQQPRPCSWVWVDVDSGVHVVVEGDGEPSLMVMMIIVAKREKFQTLIC